MIRLSIRKTVMVGIAAGAAVGLVATAAAAAAPTFKITTAHKTSGSTAYTGKATGTSAKPAIHFNDVSTHINTTCVSSTASGTIKLGPKVAGAGAATITKTTWVTCKGPQNTTLKTVQPKGSVWKLNAVARPVNGVTKVSITNVKANVTISPLGCTFTVTGATDGTYNNTTHKLTVKPVASTGHKLKASNTQGLCVGTVNNGDVLQFTGAYAVTTPNGALKIS
jgi:hypothetical protein